MQTVVVVLLSCVVCGLAKAQTELEFSISPSPVGSGARAAGMADAFVAIADDATAASWNPAGLVQLERPELSIVGSFNAIMEQFDTSFNPEFEGRNSAANSELNYLSFVYPLPVSILGRNASFALNYQRKYDFSRKFDDRIDTPFVSASTGALGLTLLSGLSQVDVGFEQEGGLGTITPAFAVELTRRLSVGLSLNIWRDTPWADNGWTQKTTFSGALIVNTFLAGNLGGLVAPFRMIRKEEYQDFKGENIVLGALWSVTNKWSIGARYDSAFTGKVDYKIREFGLGGPDILRRREKREMRLPASFAVGTAYRVNDKLTLSLDLTRTNWEDFYIRSSNRFNSVAGVGTRASISGLRGTASLIDASSIDNFLTKPEVDPTITVRFGAEYVFLPKQPDEDMKRLWVLRWGAFYDEEPATGKPTTQQFPGQNFRNRLDGIASIGSGGVRADSYLGRKVRGNGDGQPDRFYGATIGAGLLALERFSFDAAYQLRYGPGVNSDLIRGVNGFEEDVFQHRFLLSAIFYF